MFHFRNVGYELRVAGARLFLAMAAYNICVKSPLQRGAVRVTKKHYAVQALFMEC